MLKVSIIVPIYNAEKYLRKCINSILEQTFKNFEVVLVDDGSTDNSANICDEYAARDDRVVVIHKGNGGVSSARNTGLNIACGEYIIFVDSEDYVSKNMIEKMVDKIDDADMVISSIKLRLDGKERDCCVSDGEYSPRDIIENYCTGVVPGMCIEGPYCKLFKANIIKAENIEFDESIKLCEDILFNIQYIMQCNKINMYDELIYFHMKENENSLSLKYREYNYENIRVVYEYTKNAAKQLGCSNEALNSLGGKHVNRLVSQVKKSVLAENKSESINCMRIISLDEEFIKNAPFMTKKIWNCITVKLLIQKKYSVVYYCWKSLYWIKKMINK